MGERKVLNKYFPPDFDHTKIPKPDKKQQEKVKERFVVRMMLPMSVRCLTCGEYMYKGKKFNSRKENVEGAEGVYLGIQIFRFYFKCITCSAEFTIKTDPQNSDYVVEGGAKANYELYKEEKKEKDAIAAEREEEERYDAMKTLENKTAESKKAMDILDALDEIRTQNARAAALGIDDVLEHRKTAMESKAAAAEQALDRDDELAARQVFAAARTKRLREDDDDERSSLKCHSSTGPLSSTGCYGSTAASAGGGSCGGGGKQGAGHSNSTAANSTTAGVSAKAAGKRAAKLPLGVVVQPKAVVFASSASAEQAGASELKSSSGHGDGGSGAGVLGLGVYDSDESGSDSASKADA